MPQMAPISWLTLFFMFTLALILFNILNYYCFYYNSSNNINNNDKYNNNEKLNNSLNWKW